MNTPTKLGGYALSLVIVFGAATGIGNVVGPVGFAGAETAHTTHANDHAADHGPAMTGASHSDSGHTARGAPAVATDIPVGLMVSQDGYTLQLTAGALPAGLTTPLTFQILGPNRQPVTGYDETHDEDLHLIAGPARPHRLPARPPAARRRWHLERPAGPDTGGLAGFRGLHPD